MVVHEGLKLAGCIYRSSSSRIKSFLGANNIDINVINVINTWVAVSRSTT